MSLIYQALKQTAPTATQQTPAPSQARRPTPVPPPAPEKHAIRVWVLVGGSVVLVAAGLLLGMAWQRGGTQAPAPTPDASPAAAIAVAPVSAAPVLAAQPSAQAPVSAPMPTAIAAADTLPPLPKVVTPVAPVAKPVVSAVRPERTAPPRVTETVKVSHPPATPATKPATAPVEKLATAPATPSERPVAVVTKAVTPTPTPASAPVPAAAPVRTAPSPVEVTAKTPSTADVSSLFDGLAQALSASDQALALQKLEAIRRQLPEGAPARWRAEGWYAYRTGNLDEAAQIYRRLLGKLPGDENASFNLAAIERQRGDTAQAREVLNDALRHHPGSSRLQGALRQLAANGAP